MSDKEEKIKVLDPEFGNLKYDVPNLLAYYRNGNNPDHLRLKALKLALSMDPSQAKKLGGNIIEQVEKQIFSLMSGGNQFWNEIGRATLNEEKKKLVAGSKDPIVLMLADRAAITWLRLQDAEIQLSAEGAKRTMRQKASLQATVARCQANYLAALEALQRYRRSVDSHKELKKFLRNKKVAEERKAARRKAKQAESQGILAILDNATVQDQTLLALPSSESGSESLSQNDNPD